MFSILSLVGGGLGGLLRFVPEVFKFLNSKADREHEFKMSSLQLQIDAARSKQSLDLVHAQGDVAEVAGDMQAYLESVKAQGQLTGNKFVDGLNMLVRPMLTYWWMLLFTAYKITVIVPAWQTMTDLKSFGEQIWGANDWSILSGIIFFWFTDRVFKHHQEQK